MAEKKINREEVTATEATEAIVKMTKQNNTNLGKPKVENKLEARVSKLEAEVEQIKAQHGINFGKGFIRDDSKQVSLHDIDINEE